MIHRHPVRLLCLITTLACATLAASDSLQVSLEEQLGQINQSVHASPAERLKACVQTTDTFVSAAAVTVEHLDKLATYAELVYHSGLVFDYRFNAIEQLNRKLMGYKETRAFKRFAMFNQAYGKGKGYLDKASAFRDALNRIRLTAQNPDLPGAAKKTLTGLYMLGTGFEQLGSSVPLLGAALQNYGTAMTSLCEVMSNIAVKGTVARKQGLFSKAEQGLLAGLPTPQGMNWYQRTALYRKGVPVVMLYAAEVGADKYYLQTSKQHATWKLLTDRQYNDAAAIAAMYRVAYGKYPDGEKVWQYLTDRDEREFLTSKAMPMIQRMVMKRRMAKVLGGLAEAGDMNAFIQAGNKLKLWSRGLGIPIAANRMDKLIRMYFVNRLQLMKTLRTVFFRLNPAIRTWLLVNKKEPESLGIPALMDLYQRYRKGDFLPGAVKVRVVDNETGKPLAAEVILTTGDQRKLRIMTAADGQAMFEPVYAGTCRLEARAEGYEPKAGRFTLKPMNKAVVSGSVRLVKLMDGSMTIRIREAGTNRLISGASVLASGPLRRRVIAQNGTAVFTRLPAGRYRLDIHAAGYAPRAGSVTVGDTPPGKHIGGTVLLTKLDQERQPGKKEQERGPDQPEEPEEYIKVKITKDADAAEKARLRRAIIAARDRKIAELLKAKANDPQRAANKKAAMAKRGKPMKMKCKKCGFNGVHWWFGDRWSCPRCEHCTMLSELDAGNGKTYGQIANEIKARYDRQIEAVRQEAARKLKALQ